jgi:hypothetical protein
VSAGRFASSRPPADRVALPALGVELILDEIYEASGV